MLCFANSIGTYGTRGVGVIDSCYEKNSIAAFYKAVD